MRYFNPSFELIFIIITILIFFSYQLYNVRAEDNKKETLKKLEIQKELLQIQKEILQTEMITGLKVDNGVLTWLHPSSGALLKGGDKSNAVINCSGTLIGCRTFLTAAHCIHNDPKNFSNYQVFFQHAGFFGVENIEYKTDEYTYPYPDADIALITLSRPVTGIPTTPINDKFYPEFGTPGVIVGFGREGGDFNDYGIKRTGTVSTDSCKANYSNTKQVCWNYKKRSVIVPGRNSNTCNVDSGGGLFINIDNQEVVAGVTTAGENPTCKPTDHSYDVNVYHYRSWIEKNAVDDLKKRHCSDLPVVGSNNVVVNGQIVGKLNDNRKQFVDSIYVPTNTSLFRVSMNAYYNNFETAPNISNFDLYVKKGSTPTVDNYDCSSTGPNQFGFCEFENPESGDWYILVNRVSGNGLFQVTGTIFKN